MKKLKLEPAQEFETVRDCLKAAIKKYAKNVAFVVKHKQDKNVTYADITYEKFGEDIRIPLFLECLVHHLELWIMNPEHQANTAMEDASLNRTKDKYINIHRWLYKTWRDMWRHKLGCSALFDSEGGRESWI